LLVFDHVPYFGRQHQCAPVIPSVEIRYHHSGLRGLVFLDEMACFGEYLELILSCFVLAHVYQLPQGRPDLASARSSVPCPSGLSLQAEVVCLLGPQETSCSSRRTSPPRRAESLQGRSSMSRVEFHQSLSPLNAPDVEEMGRRYERRLNYGWCANVCFRKISTAQVRIQGRLTHCHSMPEAIEGKLFGLLERYDCMLWSASMAEPSTTSRTP